jgi:hypothetical protein
MSCLEKLNKELFWKSYIWIFVCVCSEILTTLMARSTCLGIKWGTHTSFKMGAMFHSAQVRLSIQVFMVILGIILGVYSIPLNLL